MPLSEKVLKFIEKENLFDNSDRLLIAVSGGMDSMALLHLLYEADYQVSAAHVNYKLRGKESNNDQLLVEAFCKKVSIKLHCYEVTDEELDRLKEGNLQEKARKIRYQFFDEIIEDHNYDRLCTAHHVDDRIETLFINLVRGSSIKGLTSLSLKRGNVIRPFGNVSRNKISQYVANHNVDYRLDQSNNSNKYERNFLRNVIIKQLIERRPQTETGLINSINNLEDDSRLIKEFLDQERLKWVKEKGTDVIVGPLDIMRKSHNYNILLYKLMEPYGFNRSQTNNLIDSNTTEEVYIISESHEAVQKNQKIVIRAKGVPDVKQVVITGPGVYEFDQGSISIQHRSEAHFNQEPNEQYVHLDFAKGPLIIRPYLTGDLFKPYGMNGLSKKLSDYFGDLGLNKFEKQEIRLLTQNDQIIWVIGKRLDHRYRVKTDRDIYRLTIQEPSK